MKTENLPTAISNKPKEFLKWKEFEGIRIKQNEAIKEKKKKKSFSLVVLVV